MFGCDYYMFLVFLITKVVHVKANTSCPIRVELLENKMVKILNEDELCGCLEYEKPDPDLPKKDVPCDVQTSILDGKISFSATSICGCIGYVTNPVKEPPGLLKTNATESIILPQKDMAFEIKANNSDLNANNTKPLLTENLTSKINNDEKLHNNSEEINVKVKDTIITGSTTLIVEDNITKTSKILNDTFETTPKLDDYVFEFVTLSITPSSITVNSTIQDFTQTLSNFSSFNTSTSKPDNFTVIQNSDNPEVGDLFSNIVSNRKINYTNNDDHIRPAVRNMNSANNITSFSHSKNGTGIRDISGSEITLNVSVTNEESEKNLNHINDKNAGQINATSEELTSSIFANSFSKNSTDVQNKINFEIPHSSMEETDYIEINKTGPPLTMVVDYKWNTTDVFEEPVQTTLEPDSNAFKWVTLFDKITTSSTVENLIENYVDLPATLANFSDLTNSSSEIINPNTTDVPEFVNVSLAVNSHENSSENLSFDLLNTTLRSDGKLYHALKHNATNDTSERNLFYNSSKEFDPYNPESITNFENLVENSRENRKHYYEDENFERVDDHSSDEISKPVLESNDFNYDDDDVLYTGPISKDDYEIHANSNKLTSLNQYYNIKITTPAMIEPNESSGDGANLYDDESDTDSVNYHFNTQPKEPITNPSLFEKESSQDDNNTRNIVVIFLGILLSALIVVLIALYLYTWHIKKGSYDLQPTTGIEMGAN